MQKGGGTLEEFNRKEQAEEYRIDFDSLNDPNEKKFDFSDVFDNAPDGGA
jgi:hypothetical protein